MSGTPKSGRRAFTILLGFVLPVVTLLTLVGRLPGLSPVAREWLELAILFLAALGVVIYRRRRASGE